MLASPVPFRDLVGHTRLVALLTRAIARDTLPPTLMFVGPSGVGKWRAALATAQTVNCVEPLGGTPVGNPRVEPPCGTAYTRRMSDPVPPEIEALLKGSPKSALVQMSHERFGTPMSWGGLSRLRVVSKVQVCIMNERAHESIARLASSEGSPL